MTLPRETREPVMLQTLDISLKRARNVLCIARRVNQFFVKKRS
jgi:hypothetical protein